MVEQPGLEPETLQLWPTELLFHIARLSGLSAGVLNHVDRELSKLPWWDGPDLNRLAASRPIPC